MNLYFLSFTICCITILIFLFFLLYDSLSSFTFRVKDKEFLDALCCLGIALFIGIIICAEGCFYYFFVIRDMHCPNCNYEYKMMYRVDKCPQCNFELNDRNIEITDKEKEK